MSKTKKGGYPPVQTPAENKATQKLFRSEYREELADNLCKANVGNPQLLRAFHRTKGHTVKFNSISACYIAHRYIGVDKYLYEPNEKLWMVQEEGLYYEVEEAEVTNKLSEVLIDIAKCVAGDEVEGEELAAEFIDHTFVNAVVNLYKNVSLPKDTYNKIDKIRKVIVPEMTISRSQTITLLVNEKEKKLNGRLKKA